MDVTTIALLVAVLVVAVGGYWYFFMRNKGGSENSSAAPMDENTVGAPSEPESGSSMAGGMPGAGMGDSTSTAGSSMGTMNEPGAAEMTPDTPQVPETPAPAAPSAPSEPAAPSAPAHEMPGTGNTDPSTGSEQGENDEPKPGGTV